MARGNKKLYRCFGYEITIDQAAEFACVGVPAIRAQLSKLGGSMETVMQMYDKRYGGVIARMENYLEGDREAAAVDEIMAALGMKEEAETAALQEPEAPEREELPLAENSGVMLVEAEEAPRETPAFPRMMIEEIEPFEEAKEEAAAETDRRQLIIINKAIEAVEQLANVEIVMECASVLKDDFLYKLKHIRLNGFEHLIDWNAIAGKG